MPLSKKILIALALLLLGGGGYLGFSLREEVKARAARIMAAQTDWFDEVAPPLPAIHHLFDLGVVDADGDGNLDIYTSNHNYRQVLLLTSDAKTSRDVLTDWGLDQSRDFPGWEQSFKGPALDKPGLYVFWLGEALSLRAHKLDPQTTLAGTLRMHSTISVDNNQGFILDKKIEPSADSPIDETVIRFSAKGDARLDLTPPSRGVPVTLDIDPSLPASSIFIGNQKASPLGHAFSPYLRDRHGLAWADFNRDGKMDVFISRGGVGGTLRKLPHFIRANIRDELLVTGGQPRFTDITTQAGVEKKDCSGRHVEWVDFNGDGRIDLFINCQDRGRAEGGFPKQLYRQEADGRLVDVAIEVGLGLPRNELIDFVWMDVDGDGDIDLFTSEDKGFFLYRNQNGRFTQEFILRTDFVRGDVSGLKSEVNNYWRFDGKLMVADYDADGDLDVFVSSKKGNALLISERGGFRLKKPAEIGLPAESITAAWVDYDNDGLVDLHVFPDGLFRQDKQHRFHPTGLLAMAKGRYQAAVLQWYDRDNDGKRDVLISANDNPSLWPDWIKPFKREDDAFLWRLDAYRNVSPAHHWLEIEVAGPPGNRQAIGARVTVSTPTGEQTQEVGINDTAFFSQGHYRLYFGLGDITKVERVSVRWSDGKTRALQNIATDRLLKIEP